MSQKSVPRVVFDLESWSAFHRLYHGRSSLEAARLWTAMTGHSDIRQLEDNMGVLHLSFCAETLKECSTEETLRLFLSDVCSSNARTTSVLAADSEMTPTSSESWDLRDFRSPSPRSYRCSPEPLPEQSVAEHRDATSSTDPLRWPRT
jgi:hypothetical protein